MTAESQPPPRRSGRRRAAGLIAGLLILAFLALGVVHGWQEVVAFDWRVDPLAAAAALVAGIVVYGASALGYVRILELLSGRRVERLRVVDLWARSLLGRYVPGNVMMVASRVVLGQEAGISRRVSLAATVYEQVLTLAAAATGALVLLAAFGASAVGSAAWLVALVPLGLVALHPRLLEPLSRWALAKAGREPLGALLTTRQLVTLFLFYVIVQTLLALSVWLFVRSVAGPDAGGPAYVGLSFLASFVLSMLAFVFPSGIGIREGAFAGALSRNLPGGVAISISALTRLALTLVELLFVAGAALVHRLARR